MTNFLSLLVQKKMIVAAKFDLEQFAWCPIKTAQHQHNIHLCVSTVSAAASHGLCLQRDKNEESDFLWVHLWTLGTSSNVSKSRREDVYVYFYIWVRPELFGGKTAVKVFFLNLSVHLGSTLDKRLISISHTT